MAVAPAPSARLVRAVAAERAELERHRARLASEADELRAALARIEHGLAEIDERRGLLDRLAPAPPEPDARDDRDADRRTPRSRCAARTIREVAVQARSSTTAASRCTTASGTSCSSAPATRSPARTRVAVFLTQISRSPAVRRGARAGVYELDRGAAHRLRTQIDAPPARAQRASRRPAPTTPPSSATAAAAQHRDRPRRARARGGRPRPRPAHVARRDRLSDH